MESVKSTKLYWWSCHVFSRKRVFYFLSKLKLGQFYEYSVETLESQASEDNDDSKSISDSSFAHSQTIHRTASHQSAAQEESFRAD